MTIEEFSILIQDKAKQYIDETDEPITQFPKSIVDFVIEYAISESHFPMNYDEDRITTRLNRCKFALVMACIEVYSRVGAEGEKAHNENGVNRTYDGAWISSKLHDVLPNFVEVL